MAANVKNIETSITCRQKENVESARSQQELSAIADTPEECTGKHAGGYDQPET